MINLKKINYKRYTPVLYWLIIIALLGLYFTNDFGLMDIHKTSPIVAVGIDMEDEEVQVTAQVAVPQPSASGDNVKYIEVQGSGLTVADALNEINVKLGSYPKLYFCKLILIGEGCQKEQLFKVLGCFYRRNYSELTTLVAMCKGRAQDMFKLPANIAPENSTAIQKVLSEELKKSANVSTASLKSIAEENFCEGKACYMPYVEANIQGTSENGGNGDNVGGEEGEQSGGGEQGGQSSQDGQGGESGSGSGSEQGGKGQKMEFTARKTAVFSDGKFVGILDDRQAFALNVLKSKMNLAVIPCDLDGIHYTMGLKDTSGGAKLKVKDGVPTLTLSFQANAQIQGARVVLDPKKIKYDDEVKPALLKMAEDEVKSRFENLIDLCTQLDCDLICVKGLLHKHNYKYYEAFKDDILTRMNVEYKIKIKSLN